MQQSARLSAVIEILTEVFKDQTPADVIIDKYLKARRYIGAKDRRAIADLTWQIIRHRVSITECLQAPLTPRLAVAYTIKDEDPELYFTSEKYAPAALSAAEKGILAHALAEAKSKEALAECPTWLYAKINNPALVQSLNTNAPVVVRANFTTREQARARLKKEGLFFAPTPLSPIGLKSEDRLNLNNCMTYQDGEIEIMDEASQLIALLCRCRPHHKIIDYCAGAGGKALAIAADMHNDGLIYAHDISNERLSRIKKRAERLDVLNIKILPALPKDKTVLYDRFIIDAPCSGTGTWRRSPDAKFRLSPERLSELVKTQAELLEIGASRTAPGGRLIYITCSVLEEENESQIHSFLKAHPEFTPLNHQELWQQTLNTTFFPFETTDYLNFSPLKTQTDGFFFAALKKAPPKANTSD